MRKRILSLLLAIIMTISLGTTVLADDNAIVNSGTCGKNLTWTLDSAGLLTISGTGELALMLSQLNAQMYIMMGQKNSGMR